MPEIEPDDLPPVSAKELDPYTAIVARVAQLGLVRRRLERELPIRIAQASAEGVSVAELERLTGFTRHTIDHFIDRYGSA